MWLASCCGLRRKRKKQQQQPEERIPDERTPLLDNSILPFVAAPPPRVIDDEELLEYQRRIDRIIEETAERLVNVSTGNASLGQIRSIPSTSTLSTPAQQSAAKHDADASAADTLWRAERPQVEGSVYSMKKVSASKGKGKGPASNDTVADDEDRFGTVATYKTAVEEGDEEGDNDSAESENTPTASRKGSDSTDGTGRRRAVQDIWADEEGGRSTTKEARPTSKAEINLQTSLSMSDKDFSRLLTQG